MEFLTKRVREPDADDEKKLSHILKYLKITCNLVLTLESDKSGAVKWWVGAAFTVHHNMKIHTSEWISMCKGVVYYVPSKQNLTPRYQLNQNWWVWMT